MGSTEAHGEAPEKERRERLSQRVEEALERDGRGEEAMRWPRV